MKKLSWAIFTSLIFTLFFTIIFGGRGYTKDDLQNTVKNEYLQEYYYENLSKSVVQIYTTGDKAVSFGTGFFIDNKKTLVTNYHVVRNAQNIYILFKDDSYAYKAELIAFDEANDIALLTSKEDFEYNSLNLTFDSTRHQTIYTCGFSLDYNVVEGKILDTMYQYTYNNNINSYIKVSNVLKKGNSGGPAVDEKGNVIGIVTLGTTKSSSLVPASKIMNLVYEIHK